MAAHFARVVGVHGLEVAQQTGRVVADLWNNTNTGITDIAVSILSLCVSLVPRLLPSTIQTMAGKKVTTFALSVSCNMSSSL